MKNIGRASDFTPSDDSANNKPFNAVMVTTTAGNIALVGASGATFTLTAVPVGEWIPVGSAVRINSTSTTAVGFLVL